MVSVLEIYDHLGGGILCTAGVYNLFRKNVLAGRPLHWLLIGVVRQKWAEGPFLAYSSFCEHIVLAIDACE
jgi:hypothetical protein